MPRAILSPAGYKLPVMPGPHSANLFDTVRRLVEMHAEMRTLPWTFGRYRALADDAAQAQAHLEAAYANDPQMLERLRAMAASGWSAAA